MDRNMSFEDLEAELMRDPEFRAEYEALEPAYQVVRLRIRRGLTQGQLARLAGVRKSVIARLENGDIRVTLPKLRRIVEALGARLEVRVVPWT